MNYFVKKLRDAFGNLHVEVDKVRAIYAFKPFTPTSTADNFVTVPDGRIFYMTQIEVNNADASNAYTFHVESNDGSIISIEYKVSAGEQKIISFYYSGLSGKIYFVPSAYSELEFKPIGYLAGD